MGSIRVGNWRYKIEQTFRRTVGSQNQRLLTVRDWGKHKCHCDTQYHVAIKSGVRYWIKEILKDYKGGIDYEARQAQNLGGLIETDHGTVEAVKVIGWDEYAISFEYLAGFCRLTDISDSGERDAVTRMLIEWLRNKDVAYYDMCDNNVMVSPDRCVVKLIDFAYSPDRLPASRWAYVEGLLL